MWSSVVKMYTEVFQFIKDALSMIELTDGVTLWDARLIVFIAFGLLILLIKSFGASGVGHAISDTYSSKREAEARAKRDKEKKEK